jgi:hypothetical protein
MAMAFPMATVIMTDASVAMTLTVSDCAGRCAFLIQRAIQLQALDCKQTSLLVVNLIAVMARAMLR